MSESSKLSPTAIGCVEELFVESADEDYLVARWSAIEGHLHQFYWSSIQCLEKMSKACLLARRIPVPNSKNSHALRPLFDDLRNQTGQENLSDISYNFSDVCLKNTNKRYVDALAVSVSELIRRLDYVGSSGSRYRNSPKISTCFSLIHSIDAVYAELRNSFYCDGSTQEIKKVACRREAVSKTFTGLSVRNEPHNETTIFSLCHQNAAFYPHFFDDSVGLIWGASMVANTIPIRLSNSNLANSEQDILDIEWLLENGKMPRQFESRLKEISKKLVEYHRAKSNGSKT